MMFTFKIGTCRCMKTGLMSLITSDFSLQMKLMVMRLQWIMATQIDCIGFRLYKGYFCGAVLSSMIYLKWCSGIIPYFCHLCKENNTGFEWYEGNELLQSQV